MKGSEASATMSVAMRVARPAWFAGVLRYVAVVGGVASCHLYTVANKVRSTMKTVKMLRTIAQSMPVNTNDEYCGRPTVKIV